ncbi:LamB/YcsF family protein [Clostridium rectalis]|uniref:LamB/YcsF family protein n=1 Tax=Clostridium rectalis TaxID=2040295 RepID=UPI000F632978|nr:5-oxoprolinase subunit PxpA [Clostridium rectalis]
MEIKVDLNSDVGESFGNYTIGMDEEVLKYVSSVNIGCGFHGGDPRVMKSTVNKAYEKEIGIGAHAGFPDLIGFGRRKMDISLEEARDYIIYQMGALQAFCKLKGQNIQHFKLHGAFYNMAAVDYNLALEVAKAVYDFDKNIILLGLSGSKMIKAGKEVGLKVAEEVFADRSYNADGTLVSRKLKGAIIEDKNIAIKRVISMIKYKKVTAITGEDININADSICVHGDNSQAVAFVKFIREKLEEENIKITPLKEFI